ncbi:MULTISPECIES: DUF92 domain-containing protein [unclassified Facklamia]|uniref:DUF92 domain-containing protein n=1 Tax=Aerococcaceae TaxID=186827 RepID=UPI0013BE5BD3|nr:MULTISPECIES: DUF92 domain-containing protein [unclassified Facklamia]NEW64415.1 DUF92 domain-containing protein [Facklamia sp. 252]NEW68496.1 DUF92 domain-containing protein [Facklamia sp. 253]QQD64875.1 DUF92 domain-containing protein [Aerococcaceae bacterium zg-252]
MIYGITFIGAVSAYLTKRLTFSASIIAMMIGSSFYYFGDAFSWLTLLLLFISSSAIQWLKEQHPNIQHSLSKRDQRKVIQVLANALPGVMFLIIGTALNTPTGYFAAIATIAAATADTWASEIGVLSRSKPIHLLTFRPIKNGESGSVSLLGTLASLAGSTFIIMTNLLTHALWNTTRLPYYSLKLVMLLIISGFAGSIIDSLFGYTIQVKYQLPHSNNISETYQQGSIKIQGWAFIDNSMVNFMSTLIAGTIVWMFY